MTDEESPQSCFIAMPFHGRFMDYYPAIYEPAIQKSNLRAVRADSIFSAGDIVRQIVEAIATSSIVLADISELNANVYYEIGIAHSFGKPTVLLSQSADLIPFDLRTGRCIIYDVTLPFWAENLISEIGQSLEDSLKDPGAARPTAFLNREIAGASSNDEDPVLIALARLQSSVARLTPLAFGSSASTELTAEAQESAARQTASVLLGSGKTPDEVVALLTSQGSSVTFAEYAVAEARRLGR